MNIEREEWGQPGPDPFLADPIWSLLAGPAPAIREGRQRVLDQLGRAVLRLRIFLGWTQRQLEIASGVDQTTISRFERGSHQGMSVYRLAALLTALRVGVIEFKPPPGPPPTALELMLYGDRWERAGEAADRRLAREAIRRRARERATGREP